MNGRILIVDDIASNRILYRARLAAAFYEPLVATSGRECLALATVQQPDLILLDLQLPDLPGHEVLRRLRADPATRDILVIVLTALTDSAVRLAAFAAGADDVIDKPATDAVLLARMRNLLRAKAGVDFPAGEALAPGFAEPALAFERKATVAVVAGQGDQGRRLQADLEDALGGQLLLLSRPQALAEATMSKAEPSAVPDVFIVQDDGSDTTGTLRFLSELKSNQATRHSAVCVVGRSGDGDEAAIAFDLGADDVVGAEVTAAELALRTRGLIRRKQRGDQKRARIKDSLRLAVIDPLTGLYNRRYAMPQLTAIAARAAEDGRPYAVMIVDLDRFKLVNDRHGHGAGDQVLVEVSRRLTANLRAGDLLARIGGEEFLVALPDAGMPLARVVAERLCRSIEERPIRLASGALLAVTVSIGVAVSDCTEARLLSPEAVIEAADLALLESKGSGRNQVTFRLSAA
jgi:two-component system, cell cycle response regulator